MGVMLPQFIPPTNFKTGYIKRDYKAVPLGSRAHAPRFDIPLIPRGEWNGLIAKKDAEGSWLTDIRDRGMHGSRIPSGNQNGFGYCWAFSTRSAVQLCRARDNAPYVPLSGYAVAAIIKRGRDEGGYGLESTEWVAEHGIPSQAIWPEGSRDTRHDTPALRADAAQRKITAWMDLEPGNMDQLVTCLLLNIPVVSDFDWWGHSVCTVRVHQWQPFLVTEIWNSWADDWIQHGQRSAFRASGPGMGILEGSNVLPDGQVAPAVVMPSAA